MAILALQTRKRELMITGQPSINDHRFRASILKCLYSARISNHLLDISNRMPIFRLTPKSSDMEDFKLECIMCHLLSTTRKSASLKTTKSDFLKLIIVKNLWKQPHRITQDRANCTATFKMLRSRRKSHPTVVNLCSQVVSMRQLALIRT